MLDFPPCPPGAVKTLSNVDVCVCVVDDFRHKDPITTNKFEIEFHFTVKGSDYTKSPGFAFWSASERIFQISFRKSGFVACNKLGYMYIYKWLT